MLVIMPSFHQQSLAKSARQVKGGLTSENRLQALVLGSTHDQRRIGAGGGPPRRPAAGAALRVRSSGVGIGDAGGGGRRRRDLPQAGGVPPRPPRRRRSVGGDLRAAGGRRHAYRP